MTIDPRAAAEIAAREHYSRVLAWLTSRCRDVAAAEDALSESLVAALSQWPRTGVPENPAAWLLTVARRRLADEARHDAVRNFARQQMVLDMDFALSEPEMNDRRLELMFACAHPAIDEKVRAPLMLQVILGLEVSGIAPLFLVSEQAMAQRLVRAKSKIREARIPFVIPEEDEYPQRLSFVLMAIYAFFGAGYNAPISGTSKADANVERYETDAIWLGRIAVRQSGRQPEALGLLALMLFVEARRNARRDEASRFVRLSDQDVRRWNEDMIARADALLHEAASKKRWGRFQIEAAIQSAHVEGVRTGKTDWAAVLALHDALIEMAPNAVAAINRTLAIMHVRGAGAALNDLDAMACDKRVREYQPYWAARAHVLALCGKTEEARDSYNRAIALEQDPAARIHLEGERSRLPDFSRDAR